MADYLIYDLSGKIIRYGDCTDGFEFSQLNGNEESILMQEHIENTYVDVSTSTVVDKTEMFSHINKQEVLGDGIDELIISNLFNPTDIVVYCVSLNLYETYEVTDGSFEVIFDDDGEYKVVLSSVPFLDKEYIITVT